MAGNFIVRRNRSFHFKRSVPTRLRSIIKLDLWTQTLHTQSLTEARVSVIPLIAETNETIRRAQAEFARQRHSLNVLNKDERALLDRVGGFSGLQAMVDTAETDAKLSRAAVEMLGAPEDLLPEEWAAIGTSPEQVEADVDATLGKLSALDRQLERHRSILARRGLKPTELVEIVEPPVPVTVMLADVVGRKIRLEKIEAQYAVRLRSSCRLFQSFIGRDRPLASITKPDIRDWVDALSRYPLSTAKRFRGVAMQAACDLADKEDVRRISSATVRDKLIDVRGVLEYAVDQSFLTANPADKVKPPAPEERKLRSEHAEDKRQAFSLGQRRHLFEIIGQTYLETADEFWLPRLALYTAMRLEEMAQLLTTDVRHLGGVWTVTIADARGDKDTAKRIKNSASVRVIPIATELVEAGFIAHVDRSAGPRVFASLPVSSLGRVGTAYSRKFHSFLRDVAGITDKRLTLHSFRHTWATMARTLAPTPMPQNIIEAFMGHRETANPISLKYGSGSNRDEVAKLRVAIIAPWVEMIRPLALS